MGLTTEDKQRTIDWFKTLKATGSDDDLIRYKEIIKSRLIEYKIPLMYALHNTELERRDADFSDYYGVNIRPALLIPQTQSTPRNYICYKVEFDEVSRNNRITRFTVITFTILCEQSDLIDKKTGLSRHDMIQSIIREAFNWSNLFGSQCKLVSNKEGLTDSDFATRTLVFELSDLNSITKNGAIYNNSVTL